MKFISDSVHLILSHFKALGNYRIDFWSDFLVENLSVI